MASRVHCDAAMQTSSRPLRRLAPSVEPNEASGEPLYRDAFAFWPDPLFVIEVTACGRFRCVRLLILPFQITPAGWIISLPYQR